MTINPASGGASTKAAPYAPLPDIKPHINAAQTQSTSTATGVPSPVRNGTTPAGNPPSSNTTPATGQQPQYVAQPDKVIDQGRKKQIDDWTANKSKESGGFLGIGTTSSADHVKEALDGKTELGGLSANEKRYLVDKMLDKWGDKGDARKLANLVAKGDSDTKSIVSERLALRSARVLRDDAGKGDAGARSQAHRLAIAAIEAANGDRTALGVALRNMTPEQGSLFVQALADPNGASTDPEGYIGRLDVLKALNEGPASPTTSAMVQNVFATSTDTDVNAPEYAHNMSVAIAREWFPDSDSKSVANRNAATTRLEGILTDKTGSLGYNGGSLLLFSGPLEKRITALAVIRTHPEITSATLNRGGDPAMNTVIVRGMAEQLTPQGIPNRAATVDRMTGILGTKQGQTLFFGAADGSDKVPPQTHTLARQIVLSDSSVTADTLRKTDDPWLNEAITKPMAQLGGSQFRSDQPMTYSGKHLENMIGTSMGFQAVVPNDKSEQQVIAEIQNGTYSPYTGNDGKAVNAVATEIRKLGGDNPEVTVLPVTYSNPQTGTIQLPLYRVKTASGDKYVDNLGRPYDTFDKWKQENQLPPGTMTFPKDGHIADGKDGIQLETANTPKTPDTWTEYAGQALDVAALVGGIIVGGAVILGTGGMGIALVGVAAAGWGTYREGSELYDRYTHDQSINPFTDSEARGLWLGVAANVAGMGAFSSEAALARFVSSETRLGRAAAMTIGTGRVTGHLTNAAAFTNAGVDLYMNWGQMSGGQRVTAALQMGFWGVTSGMSARQARSFGELVNPAAAGRAILEGFNPPVVRDETLPGNKVDMVRNPENGQWTIRAGTQATDADIALHVKMTRLTVMDNGLQGMVRGLVGEPEPGTPAYKVKMESIKLHEKVQQLEAKVADPNLTPQERTQLEGDIAATQGDLNEVLQMSESVIADPNTIAARSGGRQHAERFPGLADALDKGKYAGKGYYFRINEADPNGVPQIVRVHGYEADYPPLEAVRKENTWDVEISSKPIQQSREEWRAMIAKDYGGLRDYSNMPKTEQALDTAINADGKTGASAFVRGYVQVHKTSFAYLEKNGVDVAAIVKKAAGTTDPSAADTLRADLRTAAVNYIAAAPNGSARMTRLGEVMDALPTNGERGALFTSFRQSYMPAGFKHVDPATNATSIAGTTRRADGVLDIPQPRRMPNGRTENGKFLAEDKSGANAYDPAQAQRYSDALSAGKGNITATNGDRYEGVTYFFQNEKAARAALKNMDDKGLSDRIHIGCYDTQGNFKWIR